MQKHVIAIIGNGAAGMITATHFIEQAKPNHHLEITLIEQDPEQRFGGIAYSPKHTKPQYYLNTPTDVSSGRPGHKKDLTRWILEQGLDPKKFQRVHVHRYLKERYEDAKANNPNVSIKTINGQVINIKKQSNTPSSNSNIISADQVVLATGHMKPTLPKFCEGLEENRKFLAFPWTVEGQAFIDRIEKDASVAIIGTGMSAFDTTANLHNNGHRGDIVMISRHGYTHPFGDESSLDIEKPLLQEPSFLSAKSLHAFSKAFRQDWKVFTEQYKMSGKDIIAAIRPHFTQVIQNLTDNGVSKPKIAALLKRHQSWINTNIFVIANSIGKIVYDMLERKDAKIIPANILGIEPSENGFTIQLQQKKNSEITHQNFEYVIAALGVNQDITTTKDPLWSNLLEQDFVTPHWINNGIEINDDAEVLNSLGKPIEGAFAVGAITSGYSFTILGETGLAATNLRTISQFITPKIVKKALKNVDQNKKGSYQIELAS